MNLSTSLSRLILATVIVATVSTAGCGWFRKDDKLYTTDAANRPLEVPPELEVPGADTNLASGSTATAPAARPGAASAALGFTVAGSRDDIYARVDEALGKVEGLSVASRAKLLGAFDVNYGGSNFLVRVSAVESGVYVSAVDPRGLPASGDAPAKLIENLKVALGGR